MIGQQILATPERCDVHAFPADDLFQSLYTRKFRPQITTPRLPPKALELPIIYEYWRCTGSVRSVNEVIKPAVEQECSPVRIEEYRRKIIIVMIYNQFAFRCTVECLGQGPGRHIGIERDKREARCMKEEHHHTSG